MNLTQFEWNKTEFKRRRYGLNKLVYFLCISRFVFLKKNGNKIHLRHHDVSMMSSSYQLHLEPAMAVAKHNSLTLRIKSG